MLGGIVDWGSVMRESCRKFILASPIGGGTVIAAIFLGATRFDSAVMAATEHQIECKKHLPELRKNATL